MIHHDSLPATARVVHDNLSRLSSVTHKANGTTTIDGAGYAYDNAGNRIGKGNFLTGTMESYTYDDTYQLKDVHRDSTLTENYTYDEVGNRLTSTDVASYSYNSSNQLTSADATSFTYDHNGNTTTKTDTNGQTTYAWDYENRLTSITLPGDGGVVSFKYDPFGRRIQKSSASGTTIYVYDGANGVEEVNASGAVVARYIQGAGIDEPLAQSRSGLSYYNADGLGSVTSLTDSSGAPTATFVYGAFGVLNSSTGTTANSYRYTAREYDAETGLYYYRARYYDSTTGRFISEDPIGFNGAMNFYPYVDNDPMDWVDPFGMQAAVPVPVPGPTPVFPGLPIGPQGGVVPTDPWGRPYHPDGPESYITLPLPPPALPVVGQDYAANLIDEMEEQAELQLQQEEPCNAGHRKKRKSTWDKHTKRRPGTKQPPNYKPFRDYKKPKK